MLRPNKFWKKVIVCLWFTLFFFLNLVYSKLFEESPPVRYIFHPANCSLRLALLPASNLVAHLTQNQPASLTSPDCFGRFSYHVWRGCHVRAGRLQATDRSAVWRQTPPVGEAPAEGSPTRSVPHSCPCYLPICKVWSFLKTPSKVCLGRSGCSEKKNMI